ncbi:helix-turn-helix domain-containing protein [Streptomyces variabilis]
MNTTPFYAKVAAVAGRLLVLLAALLMSAPAEISLARTAGFSGGTEYLAPFVLSLYAVCAAVIAATRKKGVRGRLSSIVGAATALGFALSAQVVAHLIAAGYVTSGPWLVAAVSSVPSIAAAHLLHLAVVPKNPTVGVTHDEMGCGNQEEPKAAETKERPKKRSQGRSKPSLEVLTGAAQMLREANQPVNAQSLADVFSVSTRTAHRYLSTLKNNALIA